MNAARRIKNRIRCLSMTMVINEVPSRRGVEVNGIRFKDRIMSVSKIELGFLLSLYRNLLLGMVYA